MPENTPKTMEMKTTLKPGFDYKINDSGDVLWLRPHESYLGWCKTKQSGKWVIEANLMPHQWLFRHFDRLGSTSRLARRGILAIELIVIVLAVAVFSGLGVAMIALPYLFN